MDESALEEIGLSRNESKVYLALLELGSCTATPLAKKCGLHRTNVYDSLQKLIERGLVSYILKEKTKYFEATDPDNLLSIIKEKETRLKELLPQLLLRHQLAKKAKVGVYEGIHAAKLTLDNFLKYKKPIYALGTSSNVSKMIGPFLENFHKRRISKKIPMRHIYNEDAKERIKYLNALPFTEAKFLPSRYSSPAATTICNNEVVIKIWAQTPLVIKIESREIADAYKKYFELMWGIARKP